MHKAASAYMQTHVTTTTPGHIVVMLYDGAITFLEQAKEEIAARNFARKGILISQALDIIAEWVAENNAVRQSVRNTFAREAVITAKVVKGKEEEASNFQNYFDFSSPLKRCGSHRLLAIRRGEREGLLKVDISIDGERMTERIASRMLHGQPRYGLPSRFLQELPAELVQTVGGWRGTAALSQAEAAVPFSRAESSPSVLPAAEESPVTSRTSSESW